jgi:DnaJ-class molecular chaperone
MQIPSKVCEDCSGSGICSECKGEGFVLKKLSDESAEKARLTAKNMATRYTAGYFFSSSLTLSLSQV